MLPPHTTPSLALNTLAWNGYPLETALESVAGLCGRVEPVYISKYDPALVETDFTDANARRLRARLDALGLKVTAMASHMDLGLTDEVNIFKRRMAFAHGIGARIIITNASRKEHETVFYQNMNELAACADELDLAIVLENPGDGEGALLPTGAAAVAVLERIGSERVKLNYDFSNVWTYSRGKLRPEEEIERILPHLGHLHLKNVAPRDGALMVCGLGEGVIDYGDLFRRFPALLNLPMSIELPIRFGYDADFKFKLYRQDPPPLDEIRRILEGSLEYLKANAG